MGYLRAGYEIDDMLTAIVALLKNKTSSPWSSWEIIRGWPEIAVFELFSKPFIYVEHPRLSGIFAQHMGGGKTMKSWEMIIGCWDDRKTGGPQEVAIMTSTLINLFGDAAVHCDTFTAAVGGVTYTSKTLIDWGIAISQNVFSRQIATEHEKEFRSEITLLIHT